MARLLGPYEMAARSLMVEGQRCSEVAFHGILQYLEVEWVIHADMSCVLSVAIVFSILD